jgi:beta-glucosidase
MLPEGFWWGTTTSSVQIEGAAPASTWKRWEQLRRVPPSGDGNGFATAYPDDFANFSAHGLTQHRMTLEWARLEPKAGHHDGEAIEHYRRILTSAHEHGIQVWAGLTHYSLPGWFADDAHGFLDDRARTYFWPRHVDFVAETFGDLVSAWVPINEPTSCAFGGWMTGEIPPGRQDPETFPKALRALHLAGLEAWKLLRSGRQPVATVMNLSPVYPAVRSREPDEREAAGVMAARFDDLLFTTWIRALRDGVLAVPGIAEEWIDDLAGAYDLIGFAYDDALSVYADGSVGSYPADARVGPVGGAPWPEGLGVVLRRLHEELPKRPLVVAAASVATPTDDPVQDEWRIQVLDAELREVERAVADGVDVRGFFFDTPVDAYEWGAGFDVQRGLFTADRKPKPSASLAADWAFGRRGAG